MNVEVFSFFPSSWSISAPFTINQLEFAVIVVSPPSRSPFLLLVALMIWFLFFPPFSLRLHEKKKLRVDAGCWSFWLNGWWAPSMQSVLLVLSEFVNYTTECEEGRLDLYQMSRHYDNLWWKIDWNCFSRLRPFYLMMACFSLLRFRLLGSFLRSTIIVSASFFPSSFTLCLSLESEGDSP